LKDLTTGKVGRSIFYFALPMLIGNVFQQFYQIVDSMVVGHYIGKSALAAVGASFPLIFLLVSLIIGVGSGFTVIISQYFGAKDMDKVKRSIDTMYYVIFFAAITLTIVGLLVGGRILELTKLPSDVLPEAKLFFNIFMGGSIFLFGFNGTAAMLRGLGDSKTPLYFLAASLIINIILDLIFVIGFHWGVAGVAYATVISEALAFSATVIYMNRYHEIIKFSIKKLPVFNTEIFWQSVRIGLPSGFQQTFVALGMIALYSIVNRHGTSVIAAYSVAGRIDSLATLPAMNFAMALSAFVGQNMGANRPDRVKKGLKATFMMSLCVSVFFTFVSMVFGKELMTLFSHEKEVVETGAQYLFIVGAFYSVFSTMFILGGTIRGAGDTLVSMFITLIALWVVRVPVSYFLSEYIGVTGIWWGIPAGWIVGVTISFLYYLSGRWKNKAVVKYPIDPGPVEVME